MNFSPDFQRADFSLPCRSGLIFATIILSQLVSQVRTTNNLALMTGSLQIFQKHACDGQELHLDCPPGTVISISLARYGRPTTTPDADQICPPQDNNQLIGGSQCLSETALTIIEEACREQRTCKLWTQPEVFKDDPCPGVRKFAEVAYKCRPDRFTNRVACEGERLRLHCNNGYRIVIYSATFGSVKEGVVECPQPSYAKDEDCGASYATENAMSSCLGRQKCFLAADVEAFGVPDCGPATRKYLKVVSTCVPLEVLAPPFGTDYDEEEVKKPSDPMKSHFPEFRPSRTPNAATNSVRLVTRSPGRHLNATNTNNKLEMQNDDFYNDQLPGKADRSDQKVVGIIAQWISANKFLAGNKEKLILYVALSVGVGLVVFLSVVGIKLCHLHAVSPKKKDVMKSLEQFPEDNSDFEPDERPPSRHPSRISVRRQDSDVQPRTPVSSDANHYYI